MSVGKMTGGFGARAMGALKAAALMGASSLALAQGAWAETRLEVNEVSGVTVEAERETGIGRLPQPVEDQPQTVHVIDQALIREQAVISLDQAVRNIPGITANTGEGGGAVAGDQFRIRGFDAQNDIASDGLRDFGAYTRDTFNTESVQVFLGPSGAAFGRGSFGGAINTSSKFAKLDDAATLQAVVGTADLARFTADVNREIGETSALRLNVLAHHNAVADIDEVEADRFGFAAAAGWGIGTDTSFDLMYFHQTDNRIPYYGVPVSGPTGGIARPLPVDRSTFYGTERDLDETEANVLTARFSHEANENFTIKNDTRIGLFAREFMAVAPSCAAACFANVAAGLPQQVTRGGVSGPYYLDQWGVQNITTGIADFTWGGFTHQFVAGIDAVYESADRLNTSSFTSGAPNPGNARPTADAYNPSPVWTNPRYINTNERSSESTTLALFASEQLWLTEELSLLAGVRWDRYEAESTLTTYGTVTSNVFTPTNPNTVVKTEISETLFSPRLSAIWEPSETTIVYLSWARSEQPPTGTAIASVGTPLSATFTAFDPTTSETFELGARLALFREDLLFSIALFETERDNATQPDVSNVQIGSGDAQRARGVELGLHGQITEAWAVETSYTYLDTETLRGVNAGTGLAVAGTIGKPIPFAAEHAATLWTTYAATEQLTLGFGARYTDEVWLNNTNTAIAPEYISYDAMVSYFLDDGLTLQLNGTNLADRDDNYDQVVGGRAAHAPGRAFVLSLTKSF